MIKDYSNRFISIQVGEIIFTNFFCDFTNRDIQVHSYIVADSLEGGLCGTGGNFQINGCSFLFAQSKWTPVLQIHSEHN